MNKQLAVLDCTLRDGGYCNEWNFGYQNIKKIVSGLVEANIDIIECGFLTEKTIYSDSMSKFNTLDEISSLIPENRENKTFVCMINYGEYDIDNLPDYDGKSIDGIRVAFHKKDLIPALCACEKIRNKGYKVFVQPMVSLSYSDSEFIDLIQRANNISPYAFYIVDSFGVMKQKDLVRLFYIVDNNLHNDIMIGYHAHNNMQLAYSNSQALVDIKTTRNLIIDCSIYGMGRGAGNLNTELFIAYLNDTIGAKYILKPLLSIIDEILISFHEKNYWGYSLPNYVSAKHNTHPNYAIYLNSKKTLTIDAMDDIFYIMNDEKRIVYDQDYIEDLYIKFMEKKNIQETNLEKIKNELFQQEIIIIAPGLSSVSEKDTIISYASQKNVITISINHEYPEYATNYIFLSNLRRFRELDSSKRGKCIVTSNIPYVDTYLQISYSSLLNNIDFVKDNSGMMLIKFLIDMGVKKIWLAGMDGYSVDPTQNFADTNMSFYTQKAIFEAMNTGMKTMLTEYSKVIDIEFLTRPQHISLNN